MDDLDLVRIRNAVADHAGDYVDPASPDPAAVAAIVATRHLGLLITRHGAEAVTRAANNVIRADPRVLNATPAARQENVEQRNRRVAALFELACHALKAGRLSAADLHICTGERIDPDHVQQGQTWATLREQVDQAATPA